MVSSHCFLLLPSSVLLSRACAARGAMSNVAETFPRVRVVQTSRKAYRNVSQPRKPASPRIRTGSLDAKLYTPSRRLGIPAAYLRNSLSMLISQ